jgi:serine/threonine-protein kinase RsbW
VISPSRHPLSSLRQTIPSRAQEAESLCLKVRVFMQEAGLPETCFAVELLTRECLFNAIIHGNRNAADKSVDLTLSLGRKWIRLRVCDQGPGFAWRKARRASFDTLIPSGRGLRICALYAERVRFNRMGNRISLWIREAKPMGKDTRKNGCLRREA